MSSQRGNAVRTRPQKHQNRRVFKNDLHDTNVRTKRINQTQINNVCIKCKSILEWKIKYKKYKMIKTPRTCNKCFQKTIKLPYHTVCAVCAQKLGICPKCEVHSSVEELQNGNEEQRSTCDDVNEQDLNDSDVDSDDFSDDLYSNIECTNELSKLKLKS